MASPIGALQAAEGALTAARLGEALERLLDAWRSSRAPALAELVEAVSTALQPGLQQLERGKRDAMQRAWLAVEKARRPEDVPRLVKALSETHSRSTDAMARAKKIERWPEDPRVGALLVDQLLHPQFHASSSKPFWQVVFGLFRVHADPRSIGLLEGYLKRLPKVLGPDEYGDPKAAMRSWMGGRTSETLAWLEERFTPAPALEPEASLLIERCASLLGKTQATTSSVFDGVLAAPADDQARAVCADALQERGDPRGELISLQLARAAGRATPESVAAEDALLKRHLAQWLGPLRDALDPRFCMFEKGFLSQAFLRQDAQSLKGCVESLWWSTVSSLHAPWGVGAESLLRVAPLGALAHLETTQEVFSAEPLDVVSLSIPGPDFQFRSGAGGYVSILDTADIETMARSKTFPRLRHLALRGVHKEREGGYFAFLRRIPWFERIEALGANANSSSPPPLRDWLAALEAFPQLRVLAVERSSNEFAIWLTRGRSAKWAAEVWMTRSWFPALVPTLEEALPALESLTLRVAPAPGPIHQKAVAAVRTRTKRPDIGLEPAPQGLTPLHRPLSLGDLWLSRSGRAGAPRPT